jgi:hypothetical protein
VPNISNDIRRATIGSGIFFIAGHEIDKFEFIVFSGKGGDQDIGFGDVFLPDFGIRSHLNPEFAATLFVKDPGKYGWRIEARKTTPLDASIL